ncbi:hypothetical protein RCL_jg3577.t1 [Rhizophagus clarus]|uniref:Cryptic loci regulator 2 N-terminal domain-containing protein n=1 Tax=Rhizophagus clarus TaxID=94130 RepID=A0A8H3R016_9GLOM|nr:hypothetical protein RCL_jg3577.t1 [Rhizophagus clarus]
MEANNQVKRTSIQVTTSDGDPSTWPNTELRIRNGDYALFFYEVDKDCPVYKQWLETLGDVISQVEKTGESFILQDFPPGGQAKGLVERTDIYLFGLPRGRRFRSKNEFIPHFRWLYLGKTGSCICKYCNVRIRNKKTTSQDYIEDINDRDHETLSRHFGPIYRPREIVWVVGPNINLMIPTSDESFDKRDINEYYNWPGYVMNIIEQGEILPDNTQISETIYEVQLLALDRIRYYPESSLIPWIVREAEPAITNFCTNSHINDYFNKAINIATTCQNSFVTNKKYKFKISNHLITSIKDKEQKKRIKESKKYPHYYEIVFGTEVIRTNDLIRLTVEEDETSSQDKEFFRIVTIYRIEHDQIQFTGDIYVRVDDGDDIFKKLGIGESDERLQRTLNIGKYMYIPKNFPQEEYTVDMEDLAGRFYINWEDSTKRMCPTEEKFSRDVNDYTVDLHYRMKTQKKVTPIVPLGSNDYESDTLMSDIDSLNTLELNQSFISSINDEAVKGLDSMDDTKFDLAMVVHSNSNSNSLKLQIYD